MLIEAASSALIRRCCETTLAGVASFRPRCYEQRGLFFFVVARSVCTPTSHILSDYGTKAGRCLRSGSTLMPGPVAVKRLAAIIRFFLLFFIICSIAYRTSQDRSTCNASAMADNWSYNSHSSLMPNCPPIFVCDLMRRRPNVSRRGLLMAYPSSHWP